MKYGLIGEHLTHSFSKEIHEKIAGYNYELKELKKEELESFIKSKSFSAINVTIPYKEAVIELVDSISEKAREIGAVNTIVNKDGKLCGYNTDFYGMRSMIKKSGIILTGKKVLILGTGGTSKTAFSVAKDLGAKTILKVSRSEKSDSLEVVSYATAYAEHKDADIIINTTPCGMYPNVYDTPIDINRFKNLSSVVDVIYNPLSTLLIQNAKEMDIPCVSGLYMLVAQAVYACELFLDKSFEESLIDDVYREILASKKNIVLIGMPSSGKTTIGKLVAEKLSREFIDTDDEITKKENKEISLIFEESGEEYFRNLETEIVKNISTLTGKVISTGGGAVLKSENLEALRLNSEIFLLDRDISFLLPTSDRPLANSKEKIQALYSERMPIYKAAADKVIKVKTDAIKAADEIIKVGNYYENKSY